MKCFVYESKKRLGFFVAFPKKDDFSSIDKKTLDALGLVFRKAVDMTDHPIGLPTADELEAAFKSKHCAPFGVTVRMEELS
jgi:hypothetical protein